MNRVQAGILAFSMTCSTAALAGDFDGSKDLICATLRTVECGTTDACLVGTATDVNVPQFFSLRFSEKSIQATRPDGSELDTKFGDTIQNGGRLIIQGEEGGRGWSASISEETGKIVVAVAGDDVAFSFFGACIPQP